MIQFTHGKRDAAPTPAAAGGRIKVSPLAKVTAAKAGIQTMFLSKNVKLKAIVSCSSEA